MRLYPECFDVDPAENGDLDPEQEREFRSWFRGTVRGHHGSYLLLTIGNCWPPKWWGRYLTWKEQQIRTTEYVRLAPWTGTPEELHEKASRDEVFVWGVTEDGIATRYGSVAWVGIEDSDGSPFEVEPRFRWMARHTMLSRTVDS